MKKIGIILSVLILGISCQKEVKTETSFKKSGEVYDSHYYLDNKEVDENQIDFDNESLFFLLVYGDPDDSTSERMEVRAFTDSLNYLTYGDDHNMYLSFFDQTTRHLADYAESSGAVEDAELTEEVPQWYLDYCQDYVYQEAEANGIASVSTISNALLHKGYSTGPTWWLHNGTGQPWLWIIGYKEQVSSITTAGIYGYHACYNKKFYRNKEFSLWVWGNNRIPFTGAFAHFNDKGNSWFEFHF